MIQMVLRSSSQNIDRLVSMQCAGEVLITGGLGALGVLAALWAVLSSSAPSDNSAGSGAGSQSSGGGSRSGASGRSGSGEGSMHVRLLSRSGRPTRDALQPGSALHALLAGGSGGASGSSIRAAMVTMQRCDAAAAEEAADVLTGCGSATCTVLHAAGVLQVNLFQLSY